MKKASLIISISLFTGFLFSNVFAQNVQKPYQTYVNKLRTCSPYTYNIDGDSSISRILGWYNRRCIVRTYTYTDAVECTFKTQELKEYIKALPPAKVYASSVNKQPTELTFEAATYMNNFAALNKKYKDAGICISSSENSDGNSSENQN